MTSPDAGTPDEPLVTETGPVAAPRFPLADGARRAPADEPVLPEQAREDTDAAWGEYQETGDDRLHRDRPPHWDDF